MPTVADSLRGARSLAGLTQAQVAARAGIRQSKLSDYERGVIVPAAPIADRILRAARLRPSEMLELHAEAVLRAARRFHITGVRVFGSAVHGTDTTDSDIDLLVTFGPEASLLDQAGFAQSVENLIGYPVDVISDRAESNEIMDRIRAEAVPL